MFFRSPARFLFLVVLALSSPIAAQTVNIGTTYSPNIPGSAIDVRSSWGFAGYFSNTYTVSTALVAYSNAQSAFFETVGLNNADPQVATSGKATCSSSTKECLAFNAKVYGASGIGYKADVASRAADFRTTAGNNYALYLANTNSSLASGNGAAMLVATDAKPAIRTETIQNISVDAYSSLDTAVFARSNTKVGVDARSEGGASFGVIGTCFGTTGSCGGVQGEAKGNIGGNGVQGFSATAGASGVYGQNFSGFGVAGRSGSGATGVYGDNTGTGYAGYFNGRVHVNGVLSKSAGSFKIDHPEDPENKYLVHSFVESPDMMNVYNGIVSADASGEVWVELPSYFSALNIEPRYQLTPIGAPASLFIKSEVAPGSNRFQIGGAAKGQRVSWQVTGIRNDAFARANRIVAEQLKTGADRGRFLNPELYGKDESQGIVRPPAHLDPAPLSPGLPLSTSTPK